MIKKDTRKHTSIKCKFCNSSFDRANSEIKRNKKLSRNNYCSSECCGADNYTHLLNKDGTSPYAFKSGNKPVNLRDEFSDFRPYIKNIKNRKNKYKLSINLSDLKNIWNKQNGICPYTGIKLIHKKWEGKSDMIFSASLDRIDSNKGYIDGNVQFVSMAINFMKNKMTHNETIKLCKIISKKWLE